MLNLKEKFIAPKGALYLIDLLMKDGYEVYFVGGCVRDIILGNDIHDFDMCTNANPLDMIKLFEKNNIMINPKGLAFGTVTAMLDDGEYEITTYREDLEYKDYRRPDRVNFVGNLRSDLTRRDFTINAMAYNPITDDFVDYFDGISDIKNKVIRAVGCADLRFEEDALRILRAIRFAIRYGYSIEEETFKAMNESKELLDYVSKERVTDEFRKLFSYNKPIKDVFLQCSDIILYLLPELKQCYKFNQNNKYHQHDVYEHMLCVTDLCISNKFEIKMAALFHDVGKPNAYVVDNEGYGHFYGHPEISYDICKDSLKENFRLSVNEYERILDLIHYHDMELPVTKKAVKRVLNKFGLDFLEDWFILKQADIDDHIIPSDKKPKWVNVDEIKVILKEVLDEESCFTIKDLAINGNDLMTIFNLKPSKQIGNILNHLLDMVIDEKIANERESLLEESHNFIVETAKKIIC